MKVFKIIPIEVYDHDIIVSVGQTNDELYELVKENITRKKFDKLFKSKTSLATTARFKTGCIIIKFRENIDNVGIIAHESFHAINYLFDKIGIEYSYQSEEAYAYTLEYLVNQINKIKEDENNNIKL